jgi:hypothetical protein
VIALRIFLDLDTAGMAKALGIAPGIVTAQLARAVAALRAQFPPQPRVWCPSSSLSSRAAGLAPRSG